MKKIAFTLSEVLITLSIVGVVAILTVPNITKNIYTKTDIVNLQSSLKNLTDSVKSMMVNERVTHIQDSPISTEDQDLLDGFYNKYLKVNRFCEELTDCFASNYKAINGDDINFAHQVTSSIEENFNKPVILPSGVSVLYGTARDQFVYTNDYFLDTNGNYLNIFILDVNGVKPPNMMGVDMFTFALSDRGDIGYLGVVPEDVDGWNDLRETCRSGEDYGLSCAYLLQDGNWDPKIITQKYPDVE